MSRQNTRVKNKSAAPVQITAEQILREAQERQEVEYRPPKQNIHDLEELEEYRGRKRKEFEDAVRRSRHHMPNWLRYAKWEASQNELKRARSVYERALDIDFQNTQVWLKYAEMEMIAKNVNHARNVWDRAVALLPRVDQFWLKYIYMEEIMSNFAGARQLFERWMEWQPAEHAWNSYLKFEQRHKEFDRVRLVFNRYVQVHPTVKTWIKYAKFEIRLGEMERARQVFQSALEFLGDDGNSEELFREFATFEERMKEVERARAIYKYALDHVPKHRAQELYKRWIAFEKQYGDKTGIEDVIVNKRRLQYEDEIKENPKNYDTWFDYIRLEEENGELAKTREVYERAIANVPPAHEKRFWRRYIFLWLSYAIFEELDAKSVDNARAVYQQCVAVVPHKAFSFSKVWILYAQFELRQRNLAAARKVLGNAIGLRPKPKIFDAYIALELKLGQIERCRTLYLKYLEVFPENCQAWCKFAELETQLDETERVRAIYALAISQPLLDMPELVWKNYIDFEIENQQYDNARQLYEQLLERTQHVKVWISYAQFENTIAELANARAVYDRAYKALKNARDKEERLILVESWKEFEAVHQNPDRIAYVKTLLPERIKRKRAVTAEDGSPAGFEEYWDYVFPDEKTKGPSLKILELAHKWKRQKVAEDEVKQHPPTSFQSAANDDDQPTTE